MMQHVPFSRYARSHARYAGCASGRFYSNQVETYTHMGLGLTQLRITPCPLQTYNSAWCALSGRLLFSTASPRRSVPDLLPKAGAFAWLHTRYRGLYKTNLHNCRCAREAPRTSWRTGRWGHARRPSLLQPGRSVSQAQSALPLCRHFLAEAKLCP